MNKRSIFRRITAFFSGTGKSRDMQSREDAGTPLHEEEFALPLGEEGDVEFKTPEENKPLLAMLERYAWLSSASHGNAIIQELLTGNANLYVMIFRKTGQPADMLVDDGPVNGILAFTTIEVGMEVDPGPQEELIFRSFTGPETMRLVKKGKFDFLYLNKDQPSACMLLRYKDKWGIRGPLLLEEQDGGEP